jgi:type IV pilus assembly protein PilB
MRGRGLSRMVAPQKAARLGDWLLEQGHVTSTQLDLALREQKRKGHLSGEVLVELGFVSQQVLAAFLAQKTQTDQVDLVRTVVPADVLRCVPEPLARRLTVLPLALEDGLLTVAIADPFNVLTFDALEQATGLRVNLVAAAEGDLRAAIDRHCASGQSVEEIVDELLKLGAEKLAWTTEQDAPMIRLVDRLIAQAVNAGASDIHVQPEGKILRVRLRQAGMLIPKETQPALIARFKILRRMDITETRRPQGGRCTVVVGSREVGLRLSALPTSFGESIVVRLLDRARVHHNLAALEFAPDNATRFRALFDRPHGIILVTGPTGSGKTTTLYAALNQINAIERSVFTLDDPVEYQLPLIRQTQVNEAVGLTFAEGLRTLLRQDPDVMLIGETRDTETAQLMVRAALTGHLVFTTLHTNDALGAIPRLVDLGVEPYLLAPTLAGIIGQRLVRRLCPKRREPVEDPVEVLARMNAAIDSDLPPTWWRAVGCAECNRTGYRGRAGIHELVTVDARHHGAITPRVDLPRLTALAREQGFRTMFEDGVAKAMRGLTSLEEVLRVTRHD